VGAGAAVDRLHDGAERVVLHRVAGADRLPAERRMRDDEIGHWGLLKQKEELCRAPGWCALPLPACGERVGVRGERGGWMLPAYAASISLPCSERLVHTSWPIQYIGTTTASWLSGFFSSSCVHCASGCCTR